jgi:hypothetical protein
MEAISTEIIARKTTSQLDEPICKRAPSTINNNRTLPINPFQPLIHLNLLKAATPCPIPFSA